VVGDRGFPHDAPGIAVPADWFGTEPTQTLGDRTAAAQPLALCIIIDSPMPTVY
jgi:hypothetical protein